MARFLMLTVVFAIALLTLAADVSAATIYGTIFRNNQPVQNAQLTFDCWRGNVVNTDARGSYRVSINFTGRCTMALGNVTALVVFYPEPTRFDFDLVGDQLKRR